MDVLCIGHASWDINVFVAGLPAENAKCETDTLIECGGGPAANAAYLLARWGLPCGIAAAVGADGYGARIEAEFRAAGADTSLLERQPGNATPVSVILVNTLTGSRTIVNRKAHGSDGLAGLGPGAGRGPRVLLFDGHELRAAVEAMERFPEATTILDAGSVRPGTEALAGRVDHLVASERFACQFTGLADLDTPARQEQAVAALHACNGRPVVITRGEHGLLRGTGRAVERRPAFPVTAVDTTAAGDIFHGAFAYGLATGLATEAALDLAAAAAALSVTARGGRTSIPDLRAAQDLVRCGC